jgi:hypothetical protein
LPVLAKIHESRQLLATTVEEQLKRLYAKYGEPGEPEKKD